MNGIHDCGGMDGFGPVIVERNEPVFHAEWERKMFGLNWAIGANGFWNLDEYRFAMENRPATDYLGDSYYEKWLFGLETLLVARGVVTEAELIEARTATAAAPPPGATPPLTPAVAHELVRSGGSARRTEGPPPRFKVGDRVITHNINIKGHTRLPRYARARRGIIAADWGIFTFNDSSANERDERPQHVYSVAFDARELWGDNAPSGDTLHLDCWDEYLDHCEGIGR